MLVASSHVSQVLRIGLESVSFAEVFANEMVDFLETIVGVLK